MKMVRYLELHINGDYELYQGPKRRLFSIPMVPYAQVEGWAQSVCARQASMESLGEDDDGMGKILRAAPKARLGDGLGS